MVTPRRRRAWADQLVAAVIIGATELKLDLLADLAASDTKTITRILVDLWAVLGSTDETEGMNVVDLGIGVCSAEAFALGATAMPDPNTQGDYPTLGWIYAAREVVQQTLPTGGTPTAMYRQIGHFKADLRGQRKVDRGVCFLRAINGDIDGADMTIRIVGRVRTLCLT